ncbi:hypothetical protein EON67_08410, partial [archaeon]
MRLRRLAAAAAGDALVAPRVGGPRLPVARDRDPPTLSLSSSSSSYASSASSSSSLTSVSSVSSSSSSES